jgi:four helix bundle protein
MPVRSYRDLIAWQKAMDFVVEVYRVTQCFPREEQYGITSQLRRAVVSVPSNIAEGQGRQTTGEFRQFLGHARGSLLEIETQILLSERLHYLEHQAANGLLEQAIGSRTNFEWIVDFPGRDTSLNWPLITGH